MKNKDNSGGILLRIFLLFLLISSFSSAQVKSNLEIFYSLCDSSAKSIIYEINPADSLGYSLEINSGNPFSIFNSQLISDFSSKKILAENPTGFHKIIYVIEDASVKYDDMYRDGFFGDFFVPRNLVLKGNYLLPGRQIKQFSIAYMDTIRVDDIKNTENISFPFTQGEVPAEPFFSGLFEPIAAIGTAAAAIVLFFTIRSK